MGTERIKVVSDAGPLIHLTEIEGMPLLAVFETIVITEQVWSETVSHVPMFPVTITELTNIERATMTQTGLEQFVKAQQLEHLHQGELECLYVSKQRGISVIFTDDLAARDAAKHLQLTPVGSLGVVVKAYRHDMISFAEAECYISDLYEVSSLFVTKTIVEMVLEQLKPRRMNFT